MRLHWIAGSVAVFCASVAQATPSFDCNRASTPDEFAICDTHSLALLDNQVAATHAEVVTNRGRAFISSYGAELLRSRRECGADLGCIEQVQRYSIEAYSALTGKGESLPGASFQGQALRHLLRAWERADGDCRASNDPAATEAGCFLRDGVLGLMLRDRDMCPGVYSLDFSFHEAATLLRNRWLPCYYTDITESE